MGSRNASDFLRGVELLGGLSMAMIGPTVDLSLIVGGKCLVLQSILYRLSSRSTGKPSQNESDSVEHSRAQPRFSRGLVTLSRSSVVESYIFSKQLSVSTWDLSGGPVTCSGNECQVRLESTCSSE